MAAYGLKGTNVVCLCCILLSEDGLTATQLAAACRIDKAQVSRAMTELVKRGLVFRDDMNGHRYKQKYCLTDAGVLAATDIAETTREIRKVLYRGIDEKDLQTFREVLDRMCANLEGLEKMDVK
jgi:DNA-binding MarR family transcriptional regulator